MIWRGLSILATLGAAIALWFAYDELRVFRRTVFWDYRYIIFGVGAFLALSVIEALLARLKTRMSGKNDTE